MKNNIWVTNDDTLKIALGIIEELNKIPKKDRDSEINYFLNSLTSEVDTYEKSKSNQD